MPARRKMAYVRLLHTTPEAARGVISLLLNERATLRENDGTRWGWQPVKFKMAGTLYDTTMSLHDQGVIIVWCERPVAAVLRELEKSNADPHSS